MKDFTDKSLTVDELWEFCNEEYENTNFIVKKLISRFFGTIGLIIKQWGPNDTILELGCGSGKSSAELFNYIDNRYFEASEFDERFVQKLNTLKLPYKIQQESVYELNRADKSVDHIIMLEVLEHLEYPVEALNEIFRVARKSVVLSVPHEPIWCIANFIRGKYISRLGNTPGHINHWSYFSLKKLLNIYGEVRFIKMKFPWLIIEVKIRD